MSLDGNRGFGTAHNFEFDNTVHYIRSTELSYLVVVAYLSDRGYDDAEHYQCALSHKCVVVLLVTGGPQV